MTDDSFLDRLAGLAHAATPGPWRTAYPDGSGEDEGYIVGPDDAVVVNGGYDDWSVLHGVSHPDNAEFIAAANPAVVGALVEVARAARKYRHRSDSVARDAIDAALAELEGDDRG